jgi:hypothetical protein
VAATAPPIAPVRPRVQRELPRRRRGPRVSGSMGVAVVSGILAVLGVLVATGGHSGVPVAVAARDLAAGERVAPGDFRYIDATLPAGTLKSMLRPTDIGRIGGQVTTHAIASGQPVGHADVAPAAAPDQKRAMSIPIDQAHAVAGGLRRGDVVDVIDSSAGESRYVVTDARGREGPHRRLHQVRCNRRRGRPRSAAPGRRRHRRQGRRGPGHRGPGGDGDLHAPDDGEAVILLGAVLAAIPVGLVSLYVLLDALVRLGDRRCSE